MPGLDFRKRLLLVHGKVLMLGPALEVHGGISALEKSFLENWPDGSHDIKHIATMVDGSKIRKLFTCFTALGKFIFEVLFHRPDIAHIHFASGVSWFRKSIFILMARVFHLKVVAHAHGGNFNVYFDQESGTIKKRYIKSVLNLADSLIAVSEQWRVYYAGIYTRGKPVVIYNSVFCPDAVPIRVGLDPVILTLGRLGQGKGTYDLLKAIPEVLEKYPAAEFWLGGDGDIEKIRLLLKSAHWGQSVKLLGWVTGKEKEKILKRSSVFVLPSYCEGLPMALLEAMAYGIPVISTPVGGIPEAVLEGETGYLVEPGDVKSIAERITMLLGDDVLCQCLGENARRRVLDKFIIDNAISKVSENYSKVLEKRD